MYCRIAACVVAGVLLTGCAELGRLSALVQAPRFEQAPDHRAEIRMTGAGSGLPVGGAGVRLWAKVTNPNPFSLTLGTLKGTLFIEDDRAADVDFPLGLPLAAGGDTTVPIDLVVSLANLPGLADSVRRAVNRQPLAYRLEGTIGVNAGQLGQPVFGPLTLLQGDIRP
jgi:Late embryogenesis abundant protein